MKTNADRIARGHGEYQRLVSKWLTWYLPEVRDASPKTIKTYKQTFVLFFEFMSEDRGKAPTQVTFADLTMDTVIDFLLWIEDERECSIATRNNRLAAIRSFCWFLQFEAPEYLDSCYRILTIKTKKAGAPRLKYLSVEAVKAVIWEAASDNLRDHVIVQLLYDSGCRVGELVKLTPSSFQLAVGRNTRGTSTVFLKGKGRKNREVGISRRTAEAVSRLIKQRGEGLGPNDPLFIGRRDEPLQRDGVAGVLDKYVLRARAKSPKLLPGWKVTPHTMRHSRATHWLAEGLTLEQIRDLLGHEHISTTEIYAQVSDEAKRKAVEKQNEKILSAANYEPPEDKSLTEWFNSDFLIQYSH